VADNLNQDQQEGLLQGLLLEEEVEAVGDTAEEVIVREIEIVVGLPETNQDKILFLHHQSQQRILLQKTGC
jgi:hypothetical protein